MLGENCDRANVPVGLNRVAMNGLFAANKGQESFVSMYFHQSVSAQRGCKEKNHNTNNELLNV